MSAVPEAVAPPHPGHEPGPQAPPAPVTLFAAFLYWLKLGFVSFGGPAGQISMMHTELVERRRWISEHRFLHALNYTMVLPGPEAQQLATYIGWLMHGTLGGIMAGTLFVLPSLAILIALTWIYLAYGDLPVVAGVLYGIKPAVTAIVVFAAYRIGSRALRNGALWAVAAAAFVAIFALHIPFPYIVLAAGVIGFFGGRIAPDEFKTGGGHGASDKSYGPALIDDHTPVPDAPASPGGVPWAHLVGWRSGSGRGLSASLRLAGTADPDGLVLHQGSAGHLRRRLRRAALRLPRRRGAARLAHGPR